jgi:peptidoglycan hydrolase-like protein with peptidoglycan-binding domain
MTEDTGNHDPHGDGARGSELDAEPFGGGRAKSRLAWLAGLVVLGVVLQLALTLRTDEVPERQSLMAAQAPTFDIEMPDAGRDRLFTAAQIRWCLREDIRIEVFEQRLSYSEPQRFNTIVNEFNRRCTRFRYRDSDLDVARRDVDSARKWFAEEALAEAYATSVVEAPGTLAAASYSILTKDVQGLLRAVGYDPGPIDGHYGARTRAAVESFEKDLGRVATGGISEALRHELLERIRSSGVADARLLTATPAEAAAIHSGCGGAAGIAAYNRCVESELAALAQRRPAAARNVSAAERAVIEDVCLRAKLRDGETGYNRCVDEQLADLAGLKSEPSVAAMTEDQRATVEERCKSAESFYGPAAFYRCAQARLAEAGQAGKRPLL